MAILVGQCMGNVGVIGDFPGFDFKLIKVVFYLWFNGFEDS